MWVPLEFWEDDDGDEVGGEGGPRSGDVRGEKALEADLEDELGLGDGNVEMEMQGYGARHMFGWVWAKVEQIGLLVQRQKQQVGKCKRLDDGHDGDL